MVTSTVRNVVLSNFRFRCYLDFERIHIEIARFVSVVDIVCTLWSNCVLAKI